MKIHFEEFVSGFTHLLGAFFTVVCTIWLAILTWGNPPKLIVMLIFGLSMLGIYLASSALHLLDGSESFIKRLRRFDHAAIYLGIAGTYTPVIYHVLSGSQRVHMFALVWGLALIGVLSKLIFFWDGHISTFTYIAMGWVGLLFAPEVFSKLTTDALIMLIAGGMAYFVGAIIYSVGRPNFHSHFGHHEVWHVLVMTGSTLHFAAAIRYLA